MEHDNSHIKKKKKNDFCNSYFKDFRNKFFLFIYIGLLDDWIYLKISHWVLVCEIKILRIYSKQPADKTVGLHFAWLQTLHATSDFFLKT